MLVPGRSPLLLEASLKMEGTSEAIQGRSIFSAQDDVAGEDALQAAAVKPGQRSVEKSDARAIHITVSSATGAPPTVGGIATVLTPTANLIPKVPTANKTALAGSLLEGFSACHHRLPTLNQQSAIKTAADKKKLHSMRIPAGRQASFETSARCDHN
uniref:SMP domain-containing protein n=1 Tax=Physcomitrium patens TaxID=3218 RepID=A0A2K1KLA6_PHYPA|nr:hypothetical protein PHYPA_008237 [Physcomitrium patens]